MLSGSPTAAEIVAALKSDDDNLRWSAAAAIVRLASVERATERHGLLADKEQVTKLVVALVAALNDSNPRQAGGQLVAYNAAQALGAIGADAKQAIPALAAPRNRALEIDDEALRASATVALDSIDPN
jgi:HEAT repeat protein